MKISCININTNILLGKEKDEIVEFLSRKLLDSGVTFSKVMVIQSTPEQIKNSLQSIEDKFVIIIGDKTSTKNYYIKSTLSKCFGVSLQQNQDAVFAVSRFFKTNNIPPLLDNENEYYLPSGATLLKSEVSADQGFVYNADKTYIFLPNNLIAVENIYNNQLNQLIIKEVRTTYQTVTIKTFGIAEKDILFLLQDLFNNKYKIYISTYPNNLEVAVNVRYNKNIEKDIIQSFITHIYEKLRKYIYSNENISIYQMAYELLKISNKKLAIGETITSGNISNEFLKINAKSKNQFSNSIVCSDVDSVIKNFNINKSVINNYKFVSVETAYEMAANLLESSGADLVVTTCGEWESDAINTNQLVCYITVGDSDGIHVYKNTYSGEYLSVIDNISKSTMFYLIKKIKQNDLFFGQTVL